MPDMRLHPLTPARSSLPVACAAVCGFSSSRDPRARVEPPREEERGVDFGSLTHGGYP
jgi:hypothetical protein